MCVAGPPEDCDDVVQNISPAATEICDGQDNNCDTQIDEDADQDGEGPCEGDCDESDPNTNTFGFELCDGQDNDCDGEIDDGYDLDADGFTVCAGDCDDGDGLTFPGAAETNDGQDNQCEGDTGYGLIDEIGPTLLFADGTTLQWTAQNWALGYELVRSDVPSFTSGCASSLHGGTTVSVTEAPASDSLHYFLVRSLTVSAGSWGRSSAGVERTPCLGCPHDTCTAGDALPAACDTCVTQICQLDPQCCSGSWGQACIDAVFSVCGTVVCETGSCAHSLCENGSALTPGCDEPPITPSCVTEVCNADSYCCNSAWDSLCVDEVTSICGLSCE